jgi:uncharacterized Zn-binding protein involved in type VI secretion
MRKAVARLGYLTSTGGEVLAFKSNLFDNGRRRALHGEKATCGICSGSHPILGTGTQMMDHGQPVVLHGDAVLCPCGKNKVLVIPDAMVFVQCRESNEGSQGYVSSIGDADQPLITFNGRFTVIDGSTFEPLTGVSYRIVSNGRVIGRGITDNEGQTERFVTSDMQKVTLQIGNKNV